MRVAAVLLLALASPCICQSLWEKVQSGLERLEHEGRKDFGRLGSWMQPHIDRLGERVAPVLDRVGEVGGSVGPALSSLGEQVSSLGGQVGPALTTLGEQVGPALTNLGEHVKPAMDRVGEQVGPVIQGVGEQVGGLVDGLVDTVNGRIRERLDRSDDMLIVRGSGELSAPPAGGPGILGQIGNLAGHLGSQIGRLNPLARGRSSSQWWEGAGVCTQREVTSEQRTERVNVNSRGFGVLTMNMEEPVCQDLGDEYECRTGIEEGGVKKTIIVRYSCCHGYQREAGQMGCNQVSMKSLEDTVREQGGQQFLSLMEEAGSLARLKQNLTVFVPTDAAVEEFHQNLMAFNTLDNEVIYKVDEGLSYDYRRKREIVIAEAPSLEDSVLAHISPGFISVQQMQDEGLLDTQGTSKIRTTVYRTKPEKVVMANCARVTARDILATNGVVHVVDKMIQPVRHSLAEILTSDLGFSQFSEALKASGLLPLLEDPTGHFTVFAPTDRAVKKLDRRSKEFLLTGGGCAANILKSHILPNVLCSGIVEGRARTNNLLGDLVLLERNSKDILTVEGVELIMKDVMATNGVIHVIDDVIIPSSAKSLSDHLKQKGLTTLLSLLDASKLTEEVESLTNITVFLPSASALTHLPSTFLAGLAAEPASLLEFVLQHIVTPRTGRDGLTNGLLLNTEVRDQAIRINQFSRTNTLFGEKDTVVTAQCAKVQGRGEEICGGVVHTVDKVMLPTPGSLLQLVKSKSEYSRFFELLQFSGLQTELETEAEDGRTILVPSNTAFRKLDVDLREKLLSDKAYAQAVVQKHILEEVLCCSGIQKNNIFFNSSRRRASAGQVSVRRTASGHLYAEKAEISKCDMMASNGVVLQLESVLV